jgi:glyoxylase-like metal-dependent hydrolase (beta-lactamase superfamily II)
MTDTAQRCQIGEVVVTKVVEAVFHSQTEVLLPGSSTEHLLANRDWLSPQFIDDEGKLLISMHSLLIDADGRKIVVDTGVGDDLPTEFEFMTMPGDKYIRDLQAAGFAPDAVDFVVCTHLHVDHVGWNTRREGERWVPTFPNARYIFAKEAVDAWRKPAGPGLNAHGTVNTVQPLLDAGVVDQVDLDHVLTPSVRLVSTPGHSHGHFSVEIVSGGQRGFITGDASHHPVQWVGLDWGCKSDLDVEESTRTRQRILDKCLDTDTLIMGTHYAGPVAGRLATTPDGIRFVPQAS